MNHQPYRGPSGIYSWLVYIFLLIYALVIYARLEVAERWSAMWSKSSEYVPSAEPSTSSTVA